MFLRMYSNITIFYFVSLKSQGMYKIKINNGKLFFEETMGQTGC